ncbi:MAG: PaaI family thioesterase [Rhodobacteraceae bacterium]|nr:PaaI family thioesterase [Paracoccaceae bacterium]
MALKMNAEELMTFLEEVFPRVKGEFTLMELGPDSLRLRLNVNESHLRPGGTVSGPAMFALADCAFYVLLLARVGRQALAVTTGCSIDFMRKPRPAPLFAQARMLKLGQVLAVGDVLLFSGTDSRPVARASLTYSIPPERKTGIKHHGD